MSTTTIVLVALALVVGQGVFAVAIIYGVRSFGAYMAAHTRALQANTDIVLQTHNQNVLIEQECFNLVYDLMGYRASRRKQPPQSEEVVA